MYNLSLTIYIIYINKIKTEKQFYDTKGETSGTLRALHDYDANCRFLLAKK